MADRRVVFQLDTVLLGDTIMFAQRGKQFRLFYRVDTEVGFHVEVDIKHVFRITRFFGDHRDHFFRYRRFIERGGGFRGHRSHHGRGRDRGGLSHGRCRRGSRRSRRYSRLHDGRGLRGRSRRRAGIGEYKFNAVVDRRIVFELDTVLLGDTIMFAQGGKQFRLFYRVNTEVSFHVEVDIKHVFGVTRFFGYHRDHFFHHRRFVERNRFRNHRSRYRGCRSLRGLRGLRSGLSHGRYRRGRSRSRRSRIVQNKFNAVADCRIVFELNSVLLVDTIVFTQGSKQFGLFHGIDTQIGFHIEVDIEHIFGVTRLFADHFDDLFRHRRFIKRDRFRGHRSRSRYRGCRSLRGHRGLRGGLGNRRYHRGHRRRGRNSGGFGAVDGVYFVHKRLGAFHYQGGFNAVLVVVFNAKGVLHHFQDGGLLAGNFFQPRLVFGFIRNARFAHLPHFFEQSHT